MKITIYTDGAAKGNPGKAGWGAIILINNFQTKKEGVLELSGGFKHATNNQMELTAPIKALEYLKDNKEIFSIPIEKYIKEEIIEIFSDSKYVINGITSWIHNWKKNNWRTSSKKPVLNKELWIELHNLTQCFKLKWHYVPAHTGHKWNEKVDQIACEFANKF